MLDYRSIQDSNMAVPCPNFVTFTQHNLLLFQQRISQVEAAALRTYFEKTRDLIDKRVYKLCIDACIMKDETFKIILEGLF